MSNNALKQTAWVLLLVLPVALSNCRGESSSFTEMPTSLATRSTPHPLSNQYIEPIIAGITFEARLPVPEYIEIAVAGYDNEFNIQPVEGALSAKLWTCTDPLNGIKGDLVQEWQAMPVSAILFEEWVGSWIRLPYDNFTPDFGQSGILQITLRNPVYNLSSQEKVLLLRKTD